MDPHLPVTSTAQVTHSNPPEPMNLYLLAICLVASAGGFLFGFDTSVISGVIEYIASPNVFHLDAFAKGWTVSCILIGCMVGCVLGGTASSRYGRKKTLMLTAIIFLVSSISCALSNQLTAFICFRLLSGLGVGAASMLAPIYIAEVAPARHRGKLVSLYLIAIFLGQSAAFFSNYALRNVGGLNNWRWMLGVMAIPSLLLLAFLLGVPESPRWLVENGREGEARAVLARVHGAEAGDAELRSIKVVASHHTHAKLRELIRGTMLKILLIGISLAVFQQITGINVIMYYAPLIFKSAGFAADSALMQTALIGLVNLTFSVASMFFVDRLGRKPLLIIGSIGMSVAMALLAAIFLSGNARGYVVLACIMAYLAAFSFSLGPVIWILISELFPNRHRSHAVAVTTLSLWGANFLVSLSFPYLLGRLGGGVFTIYGGMCVLCLAFTLMFVRETKGRSLEDLEAELAESLY